MSLSDKEKEELETLENPQIKFMASASGLGGVFQALFGSQSPTRRKERVVELRTRMRMEELELDPKADWKKYYEIRKEEEDRFDIRFKQ